MSLAFSPRLTTGPKFEFVMERSASMRKEKEEDGEGERAEGTYDN